ncbi:transport and Golgi organization protein 11 [Daktulosphaira vitifoliae]|uniref:transport and Golgi organization protein 11 n=1 Tax=Daktulosphaira vitifoliae TaxID=58002 RepID=UPI0021AAB5D6|nr:transport and Golgi organization protein 11 [Daktulosphaira vitifoliae]
MDDYVYDSNFTEEINKKMQVPKSIKVNGDVSNFRPTNFYSDEDNPYGDNFDMQVPEKIILLGHNQHKGSSSKPKEFAIDDLIIPQPPPEEILRVQTPPSKITLSKHYFPTVLDDMNSKYSSPDQYAVFNNKIMNDDINTAEQNKPINTSFFNTSISEPMTLSEEVAHLRQQMSRVSRRVIELEHLVSQPFYIKERKLILTLACGYLVLKITSWLTRR